MLNKIDKSVWFTMATIALLGFAFFLYKYFNFQKCDDVQIVLLNNEHQIAGEKVKFKLNKTVSNAIWDFGDDSEMQTGAEVTHTYFSGGTFTVMVVFNSGCRVFETITIDQKNGIVGQLEVPAGSPLLLKSKHQASNYYWYVAGNPELGSSTEVQASFVFNMPGIYKVLLIVDGDSSTIATHEVTVTAPIVADILNEPVIDVLPPVVVPAPTPTPVIPSESLESEEPPAKQYLNITDAEMKYLLGDVIEGKRTVADFNQYLCNGANTKVVENGRATVFGELVKNLSDKKGLWGMGGKRKIKSVKQSFDRQNDNCVQIIIVEYK